MGYTEDELKALLMSDLGLSGSPSDYPLYDLERMAFFAGFATPSGLLGPNYNDLLGQPLNFGSNWDAPLANRIALTRFEVTKSTNIYAIGIRINTSSGNLIVGVYDSDGPLGAPNTLLGRSDTTACPAAGNRQINLNTNIRLCPGTYWLAVIADNATAIWGAATGGAVYGVLSTGLAAFFNGSSFALPSTLGRVNVYANVPALFAIPSYLGPVPLGGSLGLINTRVGGGSSFIDPYWEQDGSALGSSVYSWAQGFSVGRQTISGVISLETNYLNQSDQLPNWYAAELYHAGIGYFITGTDDNYIAMICQNSNQFQLVKQVAGVETVLAKRDLSNKISLKMNTKYRIDISCSGTSVTASLYNIQNAQLDTVTVADSSFTTGTPGFHSYSVKARLYNLTVF